jgi:porin
LIVFPFISTFPQANKEAYDGAITYNSSYIGDNLSNLSGGIKTGYSYLGMLNLNIGFSTDKAGLWKGGFSYINIANTHGGMPSERLIGDFQVVSNIQAGEHTYIQELWYKQIISQVEITAGLQNLNNEFVNSEKGSLFLNSSFGIPPTISTNIPAPIFPLTTLGLTLKWHLSSKSAWQAAVYDGCPTSFEQNPYNLNWSFGAKDGVFLISEYQYSAILINGRKGTYKAGAYLHYPLSTYSSDVDSALYTKNIQGLYVIADQEIWQKPGSNMNISVFTQLGLSLAKFSRNDYYLGLGIDCKGLAFQNGDDILGLAVAHAGLRGNTGEETTFELTYKLPITKNIFLQPDFQYVINPSGVGKKIRNSVETTLRFGIHF